MRNLFKTKYRVIQLAESLFRFEYRCWWSPFWARPTSSLLYDLSFEEAAENAIEHANPTYPKITYLGALKNNA